MKSDKLKDYWTLMMFECVFAVNYVARVTCDFLSEFLGRRCRVRVCCAQPTISSNQEPPESMKRISNNQSRLPTTFNLIHRYFLIDHIQSSEEIMKKPGQVIPSTQL